MTLIEQNPGSVSRVEYRIAGDPRTNHTGGFKIDRKNYPGGALIQARAVHLTEFYTLSRPTRRTLGVELPAVTSGAVGSFSNSTGEKDMVSNLTGNGASSDHFAWGRDAWTYDEARSFGDPSKAPLLSKS